MRRFIQNDFPSFAEEEVNFPPGKQSVRVDIRVKGNEYEIVNPEDEQLSKEDLKHADMPPYAVNWVQVQNEFFVKIIYWRLVKFILIP